MTNSKRKTAGIVFVLLSAFIAVLIIAQGFKGFSSSHENKYPVQDTVYDVRIF